MHLAITGYFSLGARSQPLKVVFEFELASSSRFAWFSSLIAGLYWRSPSNGLGPSICDGRFVDAKNLQTVDAKNSRRVNSRIRRPHRIVGLMTWRSSST